jgi:NADH-quinone oxidoreductase subunit C
MGLDVTYTPSPVVQHSILEKLGNRVTASGEFRGDYWLEVSQENLLEIIEILRGDPELSFTEFVDLCGVDDLPKSPRFKVVIHLYSPSKKIRIRLRCLVPDDTLTVPSLTSIWTGANWQERETYDQYGILFRGHPNLERILNAPNLKAFPQRKDYPLKGTREEAED